MVGQQLTSRKMVVEVVYVMQNGWAVNYVMQDIWAVVNVSRLVGRLSASCSMAGQHSRPTLRSVVGQ